MPFLVHPLIEKPFEVAAGCVLERALEIARHHVAAAMAVAVEVQRLEEQSIAHLPPQHVEDQRSLLVKVPIEKLDRGAIAVAYDRTAVLARVLGEIRLAILPQVPCEFVRAEILLAP